MAIFRIIKSETTNSIGESVNTKYLIQRKFLWWWINARIKYGYTLGKFHGGSSDIMIQKAIFNFNSIDEANVFLDKYLVNQFAENYKGSRIIRVVNEYNWKEMFVNTSNLTEYYASTPCYEYSYSIEELKLKIDRRIKNTKTSIV